MYQSNKNIKNPPPTTDYQVLIQFQKILGLRQIRLLATSSMAGGKRPTKESGGGGEAKKNKSVTDWEATDWAGSGGLKIASWNVAG